jgi:hypothetical protein
MRKNEDCRKENLNASVAAAPVGAIRPKWVGALTPNRTAELLKKKTINFLTINYYDLFC